MAHIVLIDDEEALREVFVEVLVGAGHRVIAAASGSEGLATIRRERPDLVICDVNMPGSLDGYGVLEAVRLDPSLASMPFLFLTGLAEPEQVRTGMNLGADDYLMKPVVAAHLLASVASRLARHAAASAEAQRRVDEIRRDVAVLLPHELRTPLTAIIGCAQLIQDSHRTLPPDELERLAAGIVRGAERLHRMTENYLLYAGLELQRLARPAEEKGPEAGSCCAPDVREAALTHAAAAGRADDLQLELGDVRLAAPGPYVRKIVCELLDNAFKFSRTGSPVRLGLGDAGATARLEVADQGRGMTAAQIRDVSAFRQFDRALFEQQGSGLGLALVKAIAEASGGRLTLESEPPHGTRAAVEWPAAAGPDGGA